MGVDYSAVSGKVASEFIPCPSMISWSHKPETKVAISD